MVIVRKARNWFDVQGGKGIMEELIGDFVVWDRDMKIVLMDSDVEVDSWCPGVEYTVQVWCRECFLL